MTKEEAIKYLQELYPHGGHCWLDEQRIEAISMAIDVLSQDQGKPEWIKELEAKLQSVSKDEFQKIMQKYEEECDLKEEPLNEDLEEEALVYGATGEISSDGKAIINKDIYEAFKAGANWQKKKDFQCAVIGYLDGLEQGKKMMRDQIMKDAVDGTVFAKLENGEIMVRSNYFMPEDLSYQDKVKLIISKEE